MKLVIQDLIRSGTEAKTILYISLDDFLLRGLFLDEITSLPEYHQQLKNLYDRYPVKIFASSSLSPSISQR